MTVGILGGLGPLSSVYFYELLTSLTAATCDQEHLDLVLCSRATTPDRTAYILGNSTDDPTPQLQADARRLEAFGVDLLAMPCNTAHYFYDRIRESITVPFLNIVEETVKEVASRGYRTIGLLATEGTVSSGAYARVCATHGLRCITPAPGEQEQLSRIIYDGVKAGDLAHTEHLHRLGERLIGEGADCVVLGCTELSLLYRAMPHEENWVDSLVVLAHRILRTAGKPIRTD